MALCSSEPRDSWSPCPPPPAGSLHLAFAAAATGVVGAGGGAHSVLAAALVRLSLSLSRQQRLRRRTRCPLRVPAGRQWAERTEALGSQAGPAMAEARGVGGRGEVGRGCRKCPCIGNAPAWMRRPARQSCAGAWGVLGARLSSWGRVCLRRPLPLVSAGRRPETEAGAVAGRQGQGACPQEAGEEPRPPPSIPTGGLCCPSTPLSLQKI